jgi:short-subunit dehydrogenase
VLRRLLDLWIARDARPSPAALQAVARLRPMTVVTGGSRGIGLALARRFARAGHDVALIARHAGPLLAAAGDIAREHGVRALPIPLDLTFSDAAQTIDARLAEDGGYVDILVNCAGVGLAGRFEVHTESEIAQLLELNVVGLTRLMRHYLPDMLARGRGGILNVASLGGLVPGPHQAAYYASKAYVISLTEAVAAENAGSGVRFSALAPGPVNTGFHAAMGAEMSFYRQLIIAMSPESVARAGYYGYLFGWRLVVPGVLSKFFALAVRVLPHRLLLPFVGWLLRPAQERPRAWHTE